MCAVVKISEPRGQLEIRMFDKDLVLSLEHWIGAIIITLVFYGCARFFTRDRFDRFMRSLIGLWALMADTNSFSPQTIPKYESSAISVLPLVKVELLRENDDYDSGVEISFQFLRSVVNYVVFGVDFVKFRQLLDSRTIAEVKNAVERNTDSLYDELYCKTECEVHTFDKMVVNPPKPHDEIPSRVVRVKCPIGIITFPNREESHEDLKCVTDFHALHVAEPLFQRMPTKIILRYLLLSNGRILKSESLFKVNVPDVEVSGLGLCVVCMTDEANIALLPCKHTSTCSGCTSKLADRCPILIFNWVYLASKGGVVIPMRKKFRSFRVQCKVSRWLIYLGAWRPPKRKDLRDFTDLHMAKPTLVRFRPWWFPSFVLMSSIMVKYHGLFQTHRRQASSDATQFKALTQIDALHRLEKELQKLLATAKSDEKMLIEKEYEGFSKLFTRFLNESSSAIDWERIERVSNETFLNKTYGANVPLVLMNSFNTDDDTEKVLRKYTNLNVTIKTFMQSRYPRINKESLIPVAKTCDTNDDQEAILDEGTLSAEIIVNNKTLSNGMNVIQLETAVGAAMKCFDKGLGVNVPRSRFLPVKKSQDLLLVMSNLYNLRNGSLAMSPMRMFPGTPLIKLGNSFDNVREFLRRFETIPDVLELDHLTVSGDVNFGRHVHLKGTVIIIANHGDRIDIPQGSVLENKIISGNLRILDH
ncbi:unnamed protein product [Notodromas monacha]|uniref:UTP--glucose-1-phosphate uridylyltransferase n=1 Tax=Notodromas monacha TaxID=399045 RepID=A0A7R9GA22_9CRUS|nr:unnamed protein product [Notodromas monacha]CAG0913231.1 unnamed protein product [Notodromas monacha]